MSARRPPSANRWGVALVLGSTALVAACEGKLTFAGQNATWGFVTIAASKNAAGQYRASPLAQFFKGAISSVPNAQITFDSCIPDVAYSEASEIVSGVTFLDAGPEVTLKIGTRSDTLPRVTGALSTVYQLGAGVNIPFSPGDSIAVAIPGATAGYPRDSIRAKSAEPFTINALTPPTGQETMQLRWTPGQDMNSAMVVSLRYSVTGSTRLSRQLLCSFVDDGVDSIPYRLHSFWSAPSVSTREAIATRLRTAIVQRGDGVLEVISRFQVPTPAVP